MRSRASLVAELGPDGSTRLSSVRSDPPLLIRSTVAGVFLVGGSAGPLGGDDLRLDVVVAEGASLCMSTVAATLLQPRTGVSRMVISVDLGPRASLVWDPRPVISVRGSEHVAITTIRMAHDAHLLWRESLVFGRHEEASGTVDQSTRVEREGKVVYASGSRLGTPVRGFASAAGMADMRSVITELSVGPHVPADEAVVRLGVDYASSVVDLAPGVRLRTDLNRYATDTMMCASSVGPDQSVESR